MQNTGQRPSRKGKVIGVLVAILGASYVANTLAPSDTQTIEKNVEPAPVQLHADPVETTTAPVQQQPPAPEPEPLPPPTPAPQPEAPAPNQLSNDNYYTNSQGETVHSPAHSSGGVPAGATAQCRDGTYSFSQSRRGTCSHHGGVAVWY